MASSNGLRGAISGALLGNSVGKVLKPTSTKKIVKKLPSPSLGGTSSIAVGRKVRI